MYLDSYCEATSPSTLLHQMQNQQMNLPFLPFHSHLPGAAPLPPRWASTAWGSHATNQNGPHEQ